jgi:hypothetical protein
MWPYLPVQMIREGVPFLPLSERDREIREVQQKKALKVGRFIRQ